MSASTEEETQLRTYRGNCHCKAFVYEVQLPEIKSAHECNCSICHKKGYLWVFPPGKPQFVKGDDAGLTHYTFGPKKLVHKFCPTCATPLMAEVIDGNRIAINVRALQNVDPWALEIQQYDGAALGDKYEHPQHKGPLPAAIDGYKLYTGSCHCGALTVAFQSKPLDETFDELIVDCSCSICSRNGYIWVYPTREKVVLFANNPSNIGKYSFARHILYKSFCKICGVPMTNHHNDITDEERKALGALPLLAESGFGEATINWMKSLHPVNLRLFPDVDLQKLKPERKDVASMLKPLYENP
ncbi:glutathione-dependent formaldehyde-activating enzyme [Chaetomium strumarium]|uniref:Glutathione-dependent formaldehyde-activating enzyme n=1 Tax=Chaetomium strumarium TaxID=1170767 RepID=A0AAJ0GW40_9PEZI|nr:glutathione-dependent formaldehyde-activating enzyme [Chaetomium strumarium]